MRVFISWSGARSHAGALALRDWLPSVIQALQPWMSAADIQRGAQWPAEVSAKLAECNVGIICLTPENLNERWILFEAGALSKVLNAHVCTYLVGLEAADLEWPLAMFQATVPSQESTRALVQTLNRALGESSIEPARLNNIFDVWWPRLEERLRELPLLEAITPTERTSRALLEEVLSLVRQQSIELRRIRGAVQDAGDAGE